MKLLLEMIVECERCFRDLEVRQTERGLAQVLIVKPCSYCLMKNTKAAQEELSEKCKTWEAMWNRLRPELSGDAEALAIEIEEGENL